MLAPLGLSRAQVECKLLDDGKSLAYASCMFVFLWISEEQFAEVEILHFCDVHLFVKRTPSCEIRFKVELQLVCTCCYQSSQP